LPKTGPVRHEYVCAQEMKDLTEVTTSVAKNSFTDEKRDGALYKSKVISELNLASTTWVESTEPLSAIEHQLERWVTQVSEANDELATALKRLKRSFELLLSGQKIADATEVLAQVEGALKSAGMAKNVA
jgi:hypothetical protein